MGRNKFENDRKDCWTVTTHVVEWWAALERLYHYYIEVSGFRKLAVTSYGFTATHGSIKIIAYIKGGKSKCEN